MISFDFYGNIYPCELIGIQDVRLGSIHSRKTLNELISDAETCNPYFAEKTDGRCKACPWNYYCRGGCTSAILIQKKSGCKTDAENCTVNHMLYPLLIKLILEDPKQAEVLAGKRIFV